MTTRKLGRWLLVALAIIGLAFAAPLASAHGDEPRQGTETAADGAPADGGAADWAAWMEDHMGPEAVEEMESHMGVTVDEMAQDMANGTYAHGSGDTYAHGPAGDYTHGPAEDHVRGPGGTYAHGPGGNDDDAGTHRQARGC